MKHQDGTILPFRPLNAPSAVVRDQPERCRSCGVFLDVPDGVNQRDSGVRRSTIAIVEWGGLGLVWGTLWGFAFALPLVAMKALGAKFLAEYGLLIVGCGFGAGLLLGACGLATGAVLTRDLRAAERELD